MKEPNDPYGSSKEKLEASHVSEANEVPVFEDYLLYAAMQRHWEDHNEAPETLDHKAGFFDRMAYCIRRFPYAIAKWSNHKVSTVHFP